MAGEVGGQRLQFSDHAHVFGPGYHPYPSTAERGLPVEPIPGDSSPVLSLGQAGKKKTHEVQRLAAHSPAQGASFRGVLDKLFV